MISLGALISVIVYLLVVGLIFWPLHWIIGYVGVPEPFNRVARVVLAVAAVLVVISLLLGLVGYPLVRL